MSDEKQPSQENEKQSLAETKEEILTQEEIEKRIEAVLQYSSFFNVIC